MLLRARPDVLFQQVGDEGVLLAMQDEVYFGLNEPAAHVWRLLQHEAASESTIALRLSELYPDVARATIEADVAELLGDLRAQGLVELVATPSLAAQGRPVLTQAS